MAKIQRMLQRKRSSVDWTNTNEVLFLAEIGYEWDTKKFKIGDGLTAWNSLPYYVPQQMSFGHGSPGFTPVTTAAIYWDQDANKRYDYYAGSWHGPF